MSRHYTGSRARKRVGIRTRDRLLWILARRLGRDWPRHLVLVRAETVVGWHRRSWRLFGRWRSASATLRRKDRPRALAGPTAAHRL